ncbi:MAG: cell division protein FtsZ [Actinobacteria bacterium]|nr:MAG: cell division protein FtsZ [Actinomycetota bacterium]
MHDADSVYLALIKVVGIGGCGTNAVNHMVEVGLRGVEFVVVNTDKQSLLMSEADTQVHIGRDLTRGLGAGSDPDVGREAAEESREEIKQALVGGDMVFITCGEGGGTGTGAAPLVAEIAKKEIGALTVAVVTRPFGFEGRKRAQIAEEGIRRLREHVDALIVVPNDRLLAVANKNTTHEEAFQMADDVLRQGIQGITELIQMPGKINLDFADVRTILRDAGSCVMGIGLATGDDRAVDATRAAISSPLLEATIKGARGVLLAIAAGSDLTITEIAAAADLVREAAASPDENVIFGLTIDDSMPEGQVRVTVVAAGFQGGERRQDALFAAAAGETEAGAPVPVFEAVTDDDFEEPPFLKGHV